MKKVLVLLSMLVVAPLLGNQYEYDTFQNEYEVIVTKFENKQLQEKTNNYKNFAQHDLKRICEFAPRGVKSKNRVESLCDILHKQFDTIDEYVKEVIEEDQALDISQFLQNNKLIVAEDAKDIIALISNKDKNEFAVENRFEDLNNDYVVYFNKVATNALMNKKMAAIMKKHQQ